MKKIIIPILVMFIASCSSETKSNQEENNSSSEASNHVKEIKDFIPENWKVVRQVNGDLNKDNIEDIALVIQNTDKNNIIINKEMGVDTLDKNPRALVILFKDPSTNGYNLIAKNDSFILSHEDPEMSDPFSNIIIEKGVLKIYFQLFYNAGSWETTSNTYVFRYQNNEFELMGAENTVFDRSSHESTKYSINFSTKKYSVSVSNIDDEKVKTGWKKFEMPELKTLTSIPKPFTWNLDEIQL